MRLETLGRSPGDVFASVWLQKQKRELSSPNSVLSFLSTVFWVLANLPVPTPWVERTTQRRSSIAFLVLQALAAFQFFNLLSSRPFTIFSLQYLLFAFGWWEEKLLPSAVTLSEAFAVLALQNYFPSLIPSHFSTSTGFVELKFLRAAWHCDYSTHQRLQDATLNTATVVILLSDRSQPCYHKRHVEMLINNIDYNPDA